MSEMAQLAGFVAGHAIYCVSQGKTLTMPLLVIEKEGESTDFIEVKGKTSQEAVQKAERLMKKPPPGALRAVIGFEAYLNLPPGRTDAIFLHACSYKPTLREVYLAVPFRAAKKPGGFAVFRPKFFAFEDDPLEVDVLASFLRGVTLYPPGNAIWREHLDPSR